MDSYKNLKSNELTISNLNNDKSLVYSINSNGTNAITTIPEPYRYNNTGSTTTWASSSLELCKEGLKIVAWKTKISKVIFSGPATVVFFSDGTKSSVKMTSDTEYPYSVYDDREVAMIYAVLKRFMGTKWRKELKRYHYALECSIPIAVIEEYSADLDHAYLRTMIERLDKDLGTDFTTMVREIDFIRFLKLKEDANIRSPEEGGLLTIYADEVMDKRRKRSNNG